MITQIDLDFIDFFEDLFGVGFDIGADEVYIVLVVGLVEEEILLHVGDLDIDLGNPDLHVNPNGYNSHQEGEQTDSLRQGHPEDGVFWLHKTSGSIKN